MDDHHGVAKHRMPILDLMIAFTLGPILFKMAVLGALLAIVWTLYTVCRLLDWIFQPGA